METMPPTPPIPTKVTRRILPATLSRRLCPLLLSSPACLLRRRPRRLLGGRSGDDHQGGGREASPARRGLRACPIPVSLALLSGALPDERKRGRGDALRRWPETHPCPLRARVDVLVPFRDRAELPRANRGTWASPCVREQAAQVRERLAAPLLLHRLLRPHPCGPFGLHSAPPQVSQRSEQHSAQPAASQSSLIGR